MNNTINSLLFKGFTAIAAFSNPIQLLADWEPEMCWIDTDLSDLTDPKFIKLKTKISESLKNSWCSPEKIQLLMDVILIEKPKICVEIGAFTGSSVLPIAATLAHLHQGKVYAIDAWSNSVAIRNLAENDPNRTWWAAVDMNSVQSMFTKLLDSWKVTTYVEPLALSSDEAASYIEAIDFLHLDGDYSEAVALRDVELYVPKVKSGGYILLSNLFIMVNGKQPKLKAFCSLLQSCELVIEIENDNAILFRKV